jgi:outer membrane protein
MKVWSSTFLIFFTFLLFTLSIISSLEASDAVTLERAYALAVELQEGVKIAAESTFQVTEQKKRAWGALTPNLRLDVVRTYQDLSGATALARIFQPSPITNVRLTATQPLFRGLREYAALRLTEKAEESQRLRESDTRRLLYREVASSFLNSLRFEKDRQNLERQASLLQSQIEELQRRLKIGRSRKSDLLGFQSQRASIVAEMSALEATIGAERLQLQFLTSIGAETKLVLTTGSGLRTLEEYLETAKRRPDLQALRLDQEMAHENVKIAHGAHLPTLDVTGNYWLQREGFNRESRWDANLILSLPILAGGTIQSQVREQASREKQAELQMQLLRRTMEQEIRTLYLTASLDRKQLSSLEESVRLAEANYLELDRDFRLGLTQPLEVLQAQRQLQQSQALLDRAQIQSKLNLVQLDLLSGRGL